MKFCDEQITLSMKSMFVGENNAIKMTQKFNKLRFTQLKLVLWCVVSLIFSKEFKELLNIKNYNREEIRLVFDLGCIFMDNFL